MKWVIWLSVLTILLMTADGIVHIVEWTTTGDVLRRVSPGMSGVAEIRQTLVAQTAWTAVALWVIVSQAGIIWIASKFTAGRGKPVTGHR
jgi:hypothetical protein